MAEQSFWDGNIFYNSWPITASKTIALIGAIPVDKLTALTGTMPAAKPISMAKPTSKAGPFLMPKPIPAPRLILLTEPTPTARLSLITKITPAAQPMPVIATISALKNDPSNRVSPAVSVGSASSVTSAAKISSATKDILTTKGKTDPERYATTGISALSGSRSLQSRLAGPIFVWLATPLLAACLVLLLVPLPALAAPPQEAVFAGGCFWCLEHDLQIVPGVLTAESGYSGGKLANPSSHQVSAGGSGHQESVRVRFDPDRISYAALLKAYWRNIDPLDGGGHFCDRGDSYRAVIFTSGPQQALLAQASAAAVARQLGRAKSALTVQIKPLQRFWPAEEYHQNYAERHGARYGYYRWACGRDRRLQQVWGSTKAAANMPANNAVS